MYQKVGIRLLMILGVQKSFKVLLNRYLEQSLSQLQKELESLSLTVS